VVKRIVEVLEDDLHGGSAEETVSFALDGRSYEIDLSQENAKRLREALAEFIDKARPVGAAATPRRRPARSADSSKEIREWARSRGMQVNERGRIPGHVTEAYRAAHGG
jgi:hypothetical protein